MVRYHQSFARERGEEYKVNIHLFPEVTNCFFFLLSLFFFSFLLGGGGGEVLPHSVFHALEAEKMPWGHSMMSRDAGRQHTLFRSKGPDLCFDQILAVHLNYSTLHIDAWKGVSPPFS